MDNARAALLDTSDYDFNRHIQTMDIETLVETVSLLQGEMAAEQAHFDEVSSRMSEVAGTDGPEHEALSAELMAVQANLAKLMARNMKCFSQQAANENKELLADISEKTSSLNGSGSEVSSRSEVSPRSSVTNGSTSEVRSRSGLKNGEGLRLPASHRHRKTSPRRTKHKPPRRQVYDEGEPDIAGYEESLTSDDQNDNTIFQESRRDIVSPESQRLIDFGQVSGESSTDTKHINESQNVTAEKNKKNEKGHSRVARAEFERNVLKDFEKLMRFDSDVNEGVTFQVGSTKTAGRGVEGSVGHHFNVDGVTQSESYTEIDVDRIGEEDEGEEEDPSEWKQAGDGENTAIPDGPIIYKTTDNPYKVPDTLFKTSDNLYKIPDKLFKTTDNIHKTSNSFPETTKRRYSSSDNTPSSEGAGFYEPPYSLTMVLGAQLPDTVSAGTRDESKSTGGETSPEPTVPSSLSETCHLQSSSIASETVPSLSSDSETENKLPYQGTTMPTKDSSPGVAVETAGGHPKPAPSDRYTELFSGPVTPPDNDVEKELGGDQNNSHAPSPSPKTSGSPLQSNTEVGDTPQTPTERQEEVTSNTHDVIATSQTKIARSTVQLTLSSPVKHQVPAPDVSQSDVTDVGTGADSSVSSVPTVTRVSLRQTSTQEPTSSSKVHFRSYVSLVAHDTDDIAEDDFDSDDVTEQTDNIKGTEEELRITEEESDTKEGLLITEEGLSVTKEGRCEKDKPGSEDNMGNLQDVGGQEKDEGDSVSVKSAVTPACQPSEGFTADDKVKDRTTLKDWDPTLLLQDLYRIQLAPDEEEDFFDHITMEGYMEKLPINKKKATLLKTWKRRYFKAENGHLHYFEPPDTVRAKNEEGKDIEKPSGSIQLIGGSIETLDNRIIGIDDGRGRYLVVRAPSDGEYDKWCRSLKSQTVENIKATWVKPVVHAVPSRRRNVVVIDIGSCSVRAGILGDDPSLPSLFFPCIMATNPENGDRIFGFEALLPDTRSTHTLSYPVRPSVKVDKFAVDMAAMPDLFEKVFNELGADPATHMVMFSAPGNFSDKIKSHFMDILIHRFQVVGVNIVAQTLLSLYSYNSRSGIVVDVGERLEIVPVTDGYIVEAGVTRQPYGGHRVTEALNASFTESKYRFFTDVEFQIVRLAMENTCYVAEVYNEEVRRCQENPRTYKKNIHLDQYGLPPGTWKNVTHTQSRFSSPEGLFNTELWGMDNPQIHKLVAKAVQVCPMDMRREMWRSIFLSGGVTLLPGFSERLQLELSKLAPPSIKVQVHASPQRYHSAYIGACALANLQEFEQACIKADEWREYGPPSLRKWHMY